MCCRYLSAHSLFIDPVGDSTINPHAILAHVGIVQHTVNISGGWQAPRGEKSKVGDAPSRLLTFLLKIGGAQCAGRAFFWKKSSFESNI